MPSSLLKKWLGCKKDPKGGLGLTFWSPNYEKSEATEVWDISEGMCASQVTLSLGQNKWFPADDDWWNLIIRLGIIQQSMVLVG